MTAPRPYQVHPTGFVDPMKPNSPTKTLCAELLRGVGGILLDGRGKRFANELGDRAYVTQRMMEHQNVSIASLPGSLSDSLSTTAQTTAQYTILLNEASARIANKHVPL